MSEQIIAENILDEDDFLSATEQEGAHLAQPVPDSGNSGDLRLVVNADAEDTEIEETATSNGTTTTTICSRLDIYGDDYWIGSTIEVTESGHSAEGETQVVTDFAQSTGTLTHAAFTAAVDSGDAFKITVPIKTRDFKVELTASGDVGDSEFKWNHDGTTYLGRDDPNQADWLAEHELHDDLHADHTRAPAIQMENGNILMAFVDSDNVVKVKTSTDKGVTYGSAVSTDRAGTYEPHCLCSLKSGRVLMGSQGTSTTGHVMYSDDYGATWTAVVVFSGNGFVKDLRQLKSGRIVAAVLDGTTDAKFTYSDDEGANWASLTTVQLGVDTGSGLGIEEADNGDLNYVYHDSNTVRVEKSSNGGTTWILVGTVLNPGFDPHIRKDIDGTLFIVAEDNTGDDHIDFAISIDHGATWGSQTQLKAVGSVDLEHPWLFLIDNHWLVCTYRDDTNSDADCVRRGMWEAYSANGCPTATGALPLNLICDAEIIWLGSGGVSGDKWTFAVDHYYDMANIISHSPSKPWRSEQDNISCAIVIDLGANQRFYADGVGFFGCNFRTADFQMNDTDSWGSPSVDEAISFDVNSGAIDSVSGNYLKDTSLLASYKDHELRGKFLRMTNGLNDGQTWIIEDNAEEYIKLLATAANSLAATDTFIIYQSKVAKTFTGGPYRFIKIDINSQQTPNSYYQIGTMVAGRTITLTHGWQVGYNKDNLYDVNLLRSPHGGLFPVKGADKRIKWTLNWRNEEDATQEVIALCDYLEGKNLCLIPDSGVLTDVYLTKFIGDIQAEHDMLNRFNFQIGLEESL